MDQPIELTSVPKAPIDHRKAGAFVLRFRTAWQYSKDYWSDITKKPGQHARAWAMKVTGVSPWKCMDTWNHEIKGMMRIQDADTSTALLQASGDSQDGQEPWFVELVGNPEALGEPTKLMWLEWRRDEKWNEYGKRATRETNLGVKLGDHQLGIRVTESDVRHKVTARKWRLQGVPTHFGPDEVKELLTSTAFTDAQITGRGRQRTRNVWYFDFDAIHKAGETIVQSYVKISDQETMEIVAVQETARCRKISDKPLHSRNSVTYQQKTVQRRQHFGDAKRHLSNLLLKATDAAPGEKPSNNEVDDKGQTKKAKRLRVILSKEKFLLILEAETACGMRSRVHSALNSPRK